MLKHHEYVSNDIYLSYKSSLHTNLKKKGIIATSPIVLPIIPLEVHVALTGVS